MMKLIIKSGAACILFLIFAVGAHAQAGPAVDESNLINRLLTLGNNSATQADSYFINKKYTLVSRSTKNMGGYDALFMKYKIVDSTDSYTIMAIKEKIINAMYITYSKDMYINTVGQALKMGFKPADAATPDPAQTVYNRGDDMFLIRTNTVNGKTFYVMAASNVVQTGKAVLEAKSH